MILPRASIHLNPALVSKAITFSLFSQNEATLIVRGALNSGEI